MKKSILWRIGVPLGIVVLIVGSVVLLSGGNDAVSSKRHSPELEYLKAVNRVGPPKSPDLLFVLMTQFATSNLQAEGADFFNARLKEFEHSSHSSRRFRNLCTWESSASCGPNTPLRSHF